jgi:hypothetical protein
MIDEQSGRNEGGFLAGLDRQGQRRVDELIKWFAQRDPSLAWHYALGRRLQALREAVRQPLYGSRWVEELAEHLGCPRGLLYKARACSRAFTDEQVAALEQAGVTWKMVVVALGVPDRAARRSLLLRAARRRWTWEDLRLYIKQAHAWRRPGSGRPPKARSYEPGAGLEHLAQATRHWLSHYKGTWAGGPETLLERLKKLNRADYDAALLDRLRSAEQLLKSVAALSGRLRKAVAALAGHVAEVVTTVPQE